MTRYRKSQAVPKARTASRNWGNPTKRTCIVAALALVAGGDAHGADADPVEYDNVMIDQIQVVNEIEETLAEVEGLGIELRNARIEEVRDEAIGNLTRVALRTLRDVRQRGGSIVAGLSAASEQHRAWMADAAAKHEAMLAQWTQPDEPSYADYLRAANAVAVFFDELASDGPVSTKEGEVRTLIEEPLQTLGQTLNLLTQANVVAEDSPDTRVKAGASTLAQLAGQCEQSLATYGAVAARLTNRATFRDNVTSAVRQYWTRKVSALFVAGLALRAAGLDEQIANIDAYEFFHSHLASDLDRLHNQIGFALRRLYAPHRAKRHTRTFAAAIKEYDAKLTAMTAPDGFMDLCDYEIVRARNRLVIHENTFERMGDDDYATYVERRRIKVERYLENAAVAAKPGCQQLGVEVVESADERVGETLYERFLEECVK